MRVHVDASRCEGNMKCQLAAPTVFEVGDDDLSHVLLNDIPHDQVAAVERAIRICPKQAISWVERQEAM